MKSRQPTRMVSYETPKSINADDIKIFQINDSCWYASRTRMEAIVYAIRCRTNLFNLKKIHRLTGKEMNNMIYTESDPVVNQNFTHRRTFASQLKRMIDSNKNFPCCFYSEEPL
jgi:hypothetical protein